MGADKGIAKLNSDAKHRTVKWMSEGLLFVPRWSGLDSCKTMP